MFLGEILPYFSKFALLEFRIYTNENTIGIVFNLHCKYHCINPKFYKPFHIKDFADGKLSIALLKTRPNRIVIQSATHPAELRSFEALYFRSGVKLD